MKCHIEFLSILSLEMLINENFIGDYPTSIKSQQPNTPLATSPLFKSRVHMVKKFDQHKLHSTRNKHK